MRRTSYIITLLLLCYCLAGSGQELVQRQYRTPQGLSSNEVYEALADSKGFIWFATNRGVSKFDGYRFKQFTIENGLIDNVILGIVEDETGRIWCRSISGHISYIENDSAHTISAITKSYYPNSLFRDRSGSLWVGSQLNGISNKIDYPYDEINNHVLVDTIFDLHIMKHNKEVVFSRSTRSEGRSIYIDLDTGAEVRFQIVPSAANARVITDGSSIYICSENHLYIIDEQKQFHTYTLPFNIINAYVDATHNLWLCLGPDQGVALYENAELTRPPKIFLEGSTITSVTQDFEYGYWFSTLVDGVKYVSSLNALEYDLSALKGGSHHTALCNGDMLVVASTLGNFLQFSPNQKPLESTLNFLSDPAILPEGLRIVRKNKQIIEHDGDVVRNVMPSPDYHYLRPESELMLKANQNFYWGITTFNCFKADKKTNSILETYSAPSRINGSCLLGDSTFILSCMEGLWTFKNGEFKEISKSFPALRHRLNAVLLDKRNNIWIGSSTSGLFILEKDSLVHLNRENGLTSSGCNSMFIDKDSVYIGTDNGISIITNYGTSQFKIIPLTSKQGLPGKIIKSVCKIKEYLYLITDEGLFQYNMDMSNHKVISPKIYITHFSVNGRDTVTNAELNLSYDENNISIAFTGLSYLNPEGNTYRYKLDGIDEEWNQSTTGQVQYPLLPPGRYTFTVLAVNACDMEGERPTTISFVISKAYWQTWWFIFVVIALFLVLTVWISSSRINNIKARAKEQEIINAKISRVEMRALQSQMNPHFIFNCINSIQHYILEQDKLVANKLLSKFSKLVRNVLENSNSEWISIQREIETLELYIEMESVRFSSQFRYSIEVDPNINTLLDNIPPLIIQPFVENAIIHGLLPMDDKQGILEIRLVKRKDKLICTIEDNGIGRERARHIKATKEENYQSMGIAITRERLSTYDILAKHHGNLELEIEDRFMDNESPGTRVIIQIPIKTIQ